jgi:CAAX protease family protein
VNATTAAAAAAAAAWAALVSASPPWFFVAAAPFCALWIALSARAASEGLGARLRPRPGDLALALALAILLYAGARAVLLAGCGGLSDALCRPLASVYERFHTRSAFAAAVLGLVVAPAEELFWRGLVQERLTRRFGRSMAVAVTTLLAVLVALASGERFLALATLPTYAAWGALAAWRGSLVAPIVSHAVWSVLVASVAPPV